MTRSVASTKSCCSSADGTRLLGGILVGDASDYGVLLGHFKSDGPLALAPGELLGHGRAGGIAGPACAGELAQVCSCNNVSEGQIRTAIRTKQLTTIAQVKSCTRAGTGCGGCLPLVADLLKAELKAMGKTVSNHLCEHFPRSRQDLFQIVKIKSVKTFDALIAEHGKGQGCEICKPAVASILASLWNENLLESDLATLQDTNDRFLANIQRGGLYSVVPRIPGGEITPEKLIALGEIARKYGLYTKITGGQRIDMFGAPVHRLPDIWADLVAAGFESGHAYGKAVRTVKSCVGSTWCRYGVQDCRRIRHPGRDALPRHPGAAQAQGGGLRLRPRVCRGPEQGLRPDRHREGLESLRVRQRRRSSPPRRPARRRPRRGYGAQIRRSVPHVLHPDGRSAHPHVGLAGKDGRRNRILEGRDHQRPAGDRP